MKLYIALGSDLSQVNLNGEPAVVVSLGQNPQQATAALSVFAAESFTAIESVSSLSSESVDLADRVLWKTLFAALKQNGELNLLINLNQNQELHSSISSLLKLNGFSNIHVTDSLIQAKKPQWQVAGAPLKRRERQADQKQETNLTTASQTTAQTASSNPWASLSTQTASTRAVLINEDELMRDESSNGQIFQKFCGENDKITAGKPCENCTCGRKELEEGKVQQKDLEAGKVQSDCGKCYLGDAFRCASCPFAGLPAFEPGDKVRLKNSTNVQVSVESEVIQVKAAVGKKVVLDL